MISLIVLSERQNHRCAYCGIQLTFDTKTSRTSASRDHVIPRTRGGTNDESNLVAACTHCNTWRGQKNAVNFFRQITRLKQDASERIIKLEQRLKRLRTAQAQGGCPDRRRYLRYTRRQIKRISYYVQ